MKKWGFYYELRNILYGWLKKNSTYALIYQGTKKYYIVNSSSWPVTLPDENTYKETYFSTTSSITPKISSPSSR